MWVCEGVEEVDGEGIGESDGEALIFYWSKESRNMLGLLMSTKMELQL